MDNSNVTGVRAVGRALEILLAFREGDRELSAGDLLARVELSRPTLYRLLYTLESAGFVRAIGEPQRFVLGPAVGKLSRTWAAAKGAVIDLPAVGQPMMRRLWELTGETVALFVPDGVDRLCVAELPSGHALSFKRGVGYRERIMLGASGRTILAHLPHGAVELRKLAKTLPADRRPTLAAYSAELERTRRRGWAVSRSELIEGAVAMAVPFFGAEGEVAGSLAVFGPSVRLDRQQEAKVIRQLVREAESLSGALGFRPKCRVAVRVPN